MNASGVIEAKDDASVTIVQPSEYNVGDRYTRLTESRSITPSPPPNVPNMLSVKPQHIPSLSPISSSAETTPTSESPQMNSKTLDQNISPTKRARFTSKISNFSSILNNRINTKKLVYHHIKITF